MEERDKERFYRLRFYFFLGCGAVVSIIYIITLGIAINLVQHRTVAVLDQANRWHRLEYEKAWVYRNKILEHVIQHDDEMKSEMAERREVLRFLDRLERGNKDRAD